MEIFERPELWRRPMISRDMLRDTARRFAQENGIVLTGDEAETLFREVYPDWGFCELDAQEMREATQKQKK